MQSICATAQRREINQYKAARMAAGITQTKASLALFISMRALQYYESGQNEPPQDVRERMARLYRAPHLALEQRSPAALMGWLMKEKKDLDERMNDLLDIAYDNVISPDERDMWERIRKEALELADACMALGSAQLDLA